MGVSFDGVVFGGGGGDATDVSVVANYTALRAYTGSATTISVTDTGIAGIFAYDATDTTSADNGGTIIVASTKRFKRVFSGSINTQWFGAKCDWNGTTGTNDTAAIQAAIDFACYSGHKKVLHPGVSKTTGPIHLGYGYGTFQSVVFEGHGYPYRVQSGFSGSGIVATHSNAPAIVIQGGRGTVIRGIGVLGANYNWISSHNLGAPFGAPTLDDTVVSNWVDSGLDSRANTRYAPYAGIAIDPYSGTRPATSYPDVSYPVAITGGNTQYGKNYSSDVLIEDCWVGGFVVGLVNQPCDADGNADFTKLRRCQFEYNAYAVSVGNSQSRNVGLESCLFQFSHTFLTNCAHGRQVGKFGGHIDNASFFAGIQIFDFSNAGTLGPVTFTNLYCESIWKIGKYSTGNLQMNATIRFLSCEFSFDNQDDTRGVPAYIIDISSSPTPLSFDSCYFHAFPSVAMFNGSVADYRIANCRFQPTNERTNTYEKLAHNFTGGGAMLVPNGDNFRPAEFSGPMHTRYGIDSGATAVEQSIGGLQFSKRDYPICAWVRRIGAMNQREYAVDALPVWTAQAKAAFSSLTLSGKTLTGVFSGSYAEWQFANNGPYPGDVIYDDNSGSVFFVRSTTVGTKTFIAELQNNYKWNGSAYTPLVSFSSSVGNLYIGNSRVYLPAYYLRGDISTGSSTITNAGRDDGWGGFIDTEVTVGDWIGLNPLIDGYASVVFTKVTARSGASNTITISAAGLRATTVHPLGFFIRQPPANV